MARINRFTIGRKQGTICRWGLVFTLTVLALLPVQADTTNGNGAQLVSIAMDLWSAGLVVNGTGEQVEIAGSWDGHQVSSNAVGLHVEIRRPAIPAFASTPTPTPTSTQTPTLSSTCTWTPSTSPTFTKTGTASSTMTYTATPTATITPTGTSTPTWTPSRTLTNSPTHSQTITCTPTPTETASPTRTQTPSPTSTPTITRTQTPSPTFSFTPSLSTTPTITLTNTSTLTPTPIDKDGDGIPNLVEEGAPNEGDSNRDGIADSIQPDVSAFPNAVDGRYLTLIAPPEAVFQEVLSIIPDTLGVATIPEGATAPYGLLHFAVEGIPSRNRFMLILIVPDDTQGLTYWKCGGTPGHEAPHWYVFGFDGQTGAEMDGRVIRLWFQDGLRGDDDLTVNKILVDLGALLQESFTEIPDWNLY